MVLFYIDLLFLKLKKNQLQIIKGYNKTHCILPMPSE